MDKEPYCLAFTFYVLKLCICQILGDQLLHDAEAPGDQLGSPVSQEQSWPGAVLVVERREHVQSNEDCRQRRGGRTCKLAYDSHAF